MADGIQNKIDFGIGAENRKEGGRGRERKREEERGRERERDRKRRTDQQSHRQTALRTYRSIDRNKDICRETDKHKAHQRTDRQRQRQKHIQTDRKEWNRQTGSQTNWGWKKERWEDRLQIEKGKKIPHTLKTKSNLRQNDRAAIRQQSAAREINLFYKRPSAVEYWAFHEVNLIVLLYFFCFFFREV